MEPDSTTFGESDEMTVEIHLRDGSVVGTVITEADLADATTDDYIEAAVGGAPRWVWIGQAYVHNRAVSAIAYVDEPEFGQPAFGADLVEELAQ